MNAFIKFAAAAIIAVVPAAFAHAQTSDVRSQEINTADLDLNTAAGQKTLHTRIAVAVGNVCAPNEGMLDFQAMREIKACRAAATSKALASVHAASPPTLAARGGTPTLGK